MNRISVVIPLATALATLTVLVACGSGSSQPPQAPPAGAPTVAAPTADGATADGATLLETRCSGCHSAEEATGARLSAAQWDQTVTRMLNSGTPLTAAERKVLVDYLAKTYGP